MSFRCGSQVTVYIQFNGNTKSFVLRFPSMLELRVQITSTCTHNFDMNMFSFIAYRNNRVYLIEHDRDVEELGGSTGSEIIYVVDKIYNIKPECYLRNVEINLSEFEYVCDIEKTYSSKNSILTNFKKYGYHIIKLSNKQLEAVHRMFNLFYEFCKSPDKNEYSYVSLKNTQPQFGYKKTELRKEYFVCRNIHLQLRGELVYPNQEFEDIVYETFKMYSKLSESLLLNVLTELNIDEDKINEIMNGIHGPAGCIDTFGFSNMMEIFRYECEGTAGKYRMPCGDHRDASLLTFIPRCMGPPGLEVYNWYLGGWEKVEERISSNDCIVLVGELLHRLTAGQITPTSHRVVIEQFEEKDKARFSCPFEIMLNPSYQINCRQLFPNKILSDEFNVIETSPDFISRVSQKLVSVNK